MYMYALYVFKSMYMYNVRLHATPHVHLHANPQAVILDLLDEIELNVSLMMYTSCCCRSESTEGIRELVVNRDEQVLYICSKSLPIVHEFIATVERQLGEDLGAAKAAVVWRTHGALRMTNGAPPAPLSEMRERTEYGTTVFGVRTDALRADVPVRCDDDVYSRIAEKDKTGCVSVGGLAYDAANACFYVLTAVHFLEDFCCRIDVV